MLIRTRIAQLPALKSSGQNTDLGTEKNKFRGQSCTKSEAFDQSLSSKYSSKLFLSDPLS